MKKSFNIPIYGLKVEMYKDFDKFSNVFPHIYDKEDVHGLVCGTGVYIGRVSVNTLAHECLHLTLNIAEHVGLDKDNQEALCYLHGWLFEKMYKFYKEE